jgi:hypothetical protein
VVFLSGCKLVHGILIFVYICIVVGDDIDNRDMVGIPSTCLT